MIRLNKFLCCLKIELGGLLIGWVNLIAAIGIVYSSIFNCEWEDLKISVKFKGFVDFLSVGDDLLYLIGALLGGVLYGLISYFLVQGIKCVSGLD
jgi:hypothetical protein